tara:strand:+ start:63 stop:227 length:165 start_codon:yes stop_codon:yes gene_type:complete
MKKTLTHEQVKNWLGSNVSQWDLIDMLTDIANGVYNTTQLYYDILEFTEEDECI